MLLATVGLGGIVLGAVSGLLLAVQGWRAAASQEGAPRRLLLPAVLGLVVGAGVTMLVLEIALLGDNFSISYVARNSARSTPLLYKIASAWGALEGSIVLWGLVLAAYTAGAYRQVRDGDRLGAGALAVMGGVALFFFGLMATVANPFQVVARPPLDGPGPNPLLQNHPLMAIHPPMLYIGYVGWTVPFAFAISALVLGRGGAEWLVRTRRWSLIAWSALTVGILLGSWWSYEVLGWGGFWAWDPVENASLLPWLTGTALLHSAVAQARRGVFQVWNVALVVVTFALTILGTFLTRSGVLVSVHSFTQSAIGPALLGFFVLVAAGGFLLFAIRGERLASPRTLDSLASREGGFLLNNLLLSVLAFTVLLGTTYPILVEAFTGARLSVGRPFFDRMTLPVAGVLLLAMGVGPVLPYRLARPDVVWGRLRTAVLVGLAVGAALVVLGMRQPWVLGVAMFAAVLTASTLRQLWLAARLLPGRPWAAAWLVVRRNAGFWGGQLSHLGIATVALAIALSGGLAQRGNLSLTRDEPVAFGGYELVYQGSVERQEPRRKVIEARLAVYRDGRLLEVLRPSVSNYASQSQPIGTPAVRTEPTQDLYTALTGIDGEHASVDVFRFPFMWMLWVGGLITAAGGVWALAGGLGRRSRVRSAEERPAVAVAG